jgi:glycine cleavage system H protein
MAYKVLDDLRYTDDHEWLKVEDGKGRMGLTDYAQQQLSDIVYLEFPEIGREVTKGESIGVVESVKAVSDMFSPVSGKVVEINEALNDAPENVTNDPYGEGWYAVIELSDPSEVEQLMDAAAYNKKLGQ